MRETPKAAAAFDEYCLLGPARSLRKLAEKLKQTNSKPIATEATLMVWSSEHRWQERVREYDVERAKEKRLKHDADIEAMDERHAILGVKQQKKAAKLIKKLIDNEEFTPSSAVQLLKLSTDLERLARGAPTEHIEQSGSTDASEWSAIRSLLVQTLSPYPDARVAVAAALARLEGNHDGSE